MHSYKTSSPVCALGFYDRPELESRASGSHQPITTLAGTDSGDVQFLSLSPDGVKSVFSLESCYSREASEGGSRGRGSRRAAVSHVCSADIGRKGIQDLCVGREDGSVEIWSLGSEADVSKLGKLGDGEGPRLMFETNLGEGVRGMDVGTVSLGEYLHVILIKSKEDILMFE